MIDVKISKKSWLRGEGGCRSFLLRTVDNKKCCLGFCVLAAGVKRELIKDKEIPSEIIFSSVDAIPEEFKGLIVKSSIKKLELEDKKLTNEAIQVNDDFDTSDEYKIEKLSKILPKLGFNPIFVK